MENITFGCIFPALTLVFVANIVNSKLHQIRSQHRPPAVIWKKMLWLGSMRVFDDENKRKKNTRKTAINRRFWNTNETYGKIIHQFYYKFIMIQNWNAIFQCSMNAATLSVGRFINYNDFLLNFCDHTLIRQPTVYDFMTNLSKYRNQSWKLWIFNEMVLFGVVDHLLIQWKKKQNDSNYSHDIQLKYVKCIR